MFPAPFQNMRRDGGGDEWSEGNLGIQRLFEGTTAKRLW